MEGAGQAPVPELPKLDPRFSGSSPKLSPVTLAEVSVSFSRKGLSGRGRQVAGQGCSHLRFDWDGETCSKVTHVAAGRRPWFPVPWGMRGRVGGGTGFLLRGQHPGGQVTADRSNPRSPRVLGYRTPPCWGPLPGPGPLPVPQFALLTVGEGTTSQECGAHGMVCGASFSPAGLESGWCGTPCWERCAGPQAERRGPQGCR